MQREANGLEREANGLERVENYITFRASVHSIPIRSMPGLGDTPLGIRSIPERRLETLG